MPPAKKIVFATILFVIFLTTVFHHLGWLNGIETLLRRGTHTIYARVYNLRSDDSTALSCPDPLVASVALDLSRQENDALRRQLNFFTSATYQHIGADVIGRNLELVGSTLLINRGTKDGIQVGQPVVADSGVLIGKVATVHDNSAIVRLLNDSQSKIAATLTNRESSLGLVEGGYDISVRMTSIPQNEIVQVGDTIITSGLEANIPAGLIIGQVEAVVKEAYQPFQYAIVTPRVDLDRLRLVSIITGV